MAEFEWKTTVTTGYRAKEVLVMDGEYVADMHDGIITVFINQLPLRPNKDLRGQVENFVKSLIKDEQPND